MLSRDLLGADERGQHLAEMAQMNELIIKRMRTGVILLDKHHRLVLHNEAADQLSQKTLERGTALRVKLGEADLMTLDISGSVLERLDTQATDPTSDEEAEEDLPATAVTLAIDLQDDPTETPAGEPSAS